MLMRVTLGQVSKRDRGASTITVTLDLPSLRSKTAFSCDRHEGKIFEGVSRGIRYYTE